MEDKNIIKIRNIEMQDGDLLMCYSDGLVENKDFSGEYYGLEKLKEVFELIANKENNIHEIYNFIINDIKLYRGGTGFSDDLTILILKRQGDNDIISKEDKFVQELKAKEGLTTSDLKNLKGGTKREITKEMEALRKNKDLKIIINNLQSLYYTGEMLKLKEEATKYIRDGYIDKRINAFLKKAMENEAEYRQNLKNQKMQARYNVLHELYKKGDYSTVIKEIEEIIAKDGNI